MTHRGRAVKEVSVQGDQPRVGGTTTDNALRGGKGVAGGEQLGGLGRSRYLPSQFPLCLLRTPAASLCEWELSSSLTHRAETIPQGLNDVCEKAVQNIAGKWERGKKAPNRAWSIADLQSKGAELWIQKAGVQSGHADGRAGRLSKPSPPLQKQLSVLLLRNLPPWAPLEGTHP